MNTWDALVLVLCFPVAFALLFALAAIERRLPGEFPGRLAGPARISPADHQAAGPEPDSTAGTDLSEAA